MELLTTRVPRSLEAKTRLFGFELGDLLLIFLYMAMSNLLFGSTRFKFLLVWVGTAALAAVVHFAKKGKPDNYIEHLSQYVTSPDTFTAGPSDTEYRPYAPLIPREGVQNG